MTKSKASAKATSTPIKTADAALWALHNNFCKAYATMLSLEAAGGGNTPIKNATKKEKAIERKYVHAIGAATEKARAVVDAPAYTLEGMLMKIHVGGFTLDFFKAGSFSAPYHGMICANGKPQQWELSEVIGTSDEAALIVSLRADLQRFAGRRA